MQEPQTTSPEPSASQLVLHRIYVKRSALESFGVSLNLLQNPLEPGLDMRVVANIYPQEKDLYQAILGLTIQAKHQADVVWKLQLEQAGFYTVKGFTPEQQETVLNGFCMNQLYQYASAVVTQLVVQAGFKPVYLQPMDFYQLYQQQKKEQGTHPANLDAAFEKVETTLKQNAELVN